MVSFSLRVELLSALKALAEKEYFGNCSYALECLVAEKAGLPRPEARQRYSFPKGSNFSGKVREAFLKRRALEDVKINAWLALPLDQQQASISLETNEGKELFILLWKRKELRRKLLELPRNKNGA